MYSSVGNPKKKNNLTADSLGLVKMERYTIEQRVFIIEQYFKNNDFFSSKIILSDEAHFHLDGLRIGPVV